MLERKTGQLYIPQDMESTELWPRSDQRTDEGTRCDLRKVQRVRGEWSCQKPGHYELGAAQAAGYGLKLVRLGTALATVEAPRGIWEGYSSELLTLE